MSAVGKPKIVLLGQRDPSQPVELTPDEGSFESWLAVAQDMWGQGNLTPADSIFASRAIGTIVPTQGGNFGVVTYQLGHRLFTFSREGGIWIDAFEAETSLSKIEKRPKDKIKLASWSPATNQLGSNRLTHMAVLSPSRMNGCGQSFMAEVAKAMKKDGQLFIADYVRAPETKSVRGLPSLRTAQEYKTWLDAAGLKYYSELDFTGDIRVGLLRGMYNAINMVANIRKLQEPWKGQRLKAFEKELESVVMLHTAIERGEAAAIGLYYCKP